MNETDFIRQQLAAERAHLREILQAIRAGNLTVANTRPAAAYIEWAQQRLVAQLEAHRAALQATPTGSPETRTQLARVASAAAGVAGNTAAAPPKLLAERLLALLDAWSESLELLAARALRLAHWRQAARLNADTILEERQRYAAARTAVGLS